MNWCVFNDWPDSFRHVWDKNYFCHARDGERERGGGVQRKDKRREETGKKVEVTKDEEERKDVLKEGEKIFLPLTLEREVSNSLHTDNMLTKHENTWFLMKIKALDIPF